MIHYKLSHPLKKGERGLKMIKRSMTKDMQEKAKSLGMQLVEINFKQTDDEVVGVGRYK